MGDANTALHDDIVAILMGALGMYHGLIGVAVETIVELPTFGQMLQSLWKIVPLWPKDTFIMEDILNPSCSKFKVNWTTINDSAALLSQPFGPIKIHDGPNLEIKEPAAKKLKLMGAQMFLNNRAKPRLVNKCLIVFLVTLLLCSFTTNADYVGKFGLMPATAVESQKMIQFG